MLPTLDLAAFVRLFQVRAPQIMWFLGAGASRAAGIKTAGDMIWDFKQQLYRSQKRLPPSAIADIGDSGVRLKLQNHFDGLGSFPPEGSDNEYAAYFEAMYHAAKDRRSYLDALIKVGKPSFGHLALALLMDAGLCQSVWTTNFDRTVEDAAAQILGSTGRLVVADLAEPAKARDAWSAGRWPLYAKIHGDYHSERLKNTSEELQSQDADMRASFIAALKSRGLAIIGYSGRDGSVMDALEGALDNGNGYPGGLFWFKRSTDDLSDRVREFVERAVNLKVDAHVVEVESFDELLGDIVRYLPQTSARALTLISDTRPRLVKAPLAPPVTKTPVIRMNALPVTSFPAMCRFVDCEIGGWTEIRMAIEAAGLDFDASRCKEGVLAFGKDQDIRTVFGGRKMRAFDTRPIKASRLLNETGERSLLRDCLFRAVGGRPNITLQKRGRTTLLLPDPRSVTPTVFELGGIAPVTAISGLIGAVKWSEACAIRVDYKLDSLWLLLEPRVTLDPPEDIEPQELERAKEFVRARRAERHNSRANAMLNGWIKLIAGEEPATRLRAFGISDGIDAEFEISSVSGFSGLSV